MLKIKLSQVGKRNQRSYRVIIAEARSKRDGKYLEKIGHYNPNVDPAEIEINQDRLQYWQEQGAQMTEAVKKLVNK